MRRTTRVRIFFTIIFFLLRYKKFISNHENQEIKSRATEFEHFWLRLILCIFLKFKLLEGLQSANQIIIEKCLKLYNYQHHYHHCF